MFRSGSGDGRRCSSAGGAVAAASSSAPGSAPAPASTATAAPLRGTVAARSDHLPGVGRAPVRDADLRLVDVRPTDLRPADRRPAGGPVDLAGRVRPGLSRHLLLSHTLPGYLLLRHRLVLALPPAAWRTAPPAGGACTAAVADPRDRSVTGCRGPFGDSNSSGRRPELSGRRPVPGGRADRLVAGAGPPVRTAYAPDRVVDGRGAARAAAAGPRAGDGRGRRDRRAARRRACGAAARLAARGAALDRRRRRLRAGGAPSDRTPAGSFVGFGVGRRRRARHPRLPRSDRRADRPRLAAPAAGRRLGGRRDRGRGAGARRAVAPDATPAACAALGAAAGRRVRGRPRSRSGCSSLGDGAATHTEQAPGHLDERAGRVRRRGGRRAADRRPGGAGRARRRPRRRAAGRGPGPLAGARRGGRRAGRWRGELLHSSTPFGVAYHVAVWTPVT